MPKPSRRRQFIELGKKIIINWRSLYNLVRRLYLFARALDKPTRIKLLLLQLLQLAGYVVYLVGSLAVVPFINYAISPENSLKSVWMKRLYDLIATHTSFNFVLFLAIASVLVLILSRLAQIGAHYARNVLQKSLQLYYGSGLFYYYMRQNVLHPSGRNVTDVIHNVTHRMPQVIGSFINPVLQLVHTVSYLLVGLFILYLNSPILVIFAIAPVVLFLVVSVYATRFRLTKLTKAIDKNTHQQRHKMLESLLAREYIQILGKESVFSQTYRATLRKVLDIGVKRDLITLLFAPLGEILVYATLVSVIGYILISFEQLDLTRLTIFIVVIYRVVPQANQLFNIYAQLKQGVVYFDRTADDLLLALKQKISYKPYIPKPLPFRKRIRLQNVSCSYDGGKETPQVLKNINITIRLGMKIGICGESGSGKTTLLRVLIGMLLPHEGKMSIDNKTLTPALRRSWQDNLGYVSQSLILLRLSVIENIALTAEGEVADIERVRQVLSITESLDFVTSLPQGMDTILDAIDTKLSGGQKQRLVIARSLYKDPEVLVLDEATSALDKKTERKIMNNIYQAMSDKTIIMVTHRVETIKNSDLMFLMKDGSIAARGNYKQLMENKDFSLMAG